MEFDDLPVYLEDFGLPSIKLLHKFDRHFKFFFLSVEIDRCLRAPWRRMVVQHTNKVLFILLLLLLLLLLP